VRPATSGWLVAAPGEQWIRVHEVSPRLRHRTVCGRRIGRGWRGVGDPVMTTECSGCGDKSTRETPEKGSVRPVEARNPGPATPFTSHPPHGSQGAVQRFGDVQVVITVTGVGSGSGAEPSPGWTLGALRSRLRDAWRR
jgi:hypothetical protein